MKKLCVMLLVLLLMVSVVGCSAGAPPVETMQNIIAQIVLQVNAGVGNRQRLSKVEFKNFSITNAFFAKVKGQDVYNIAVDYDVEFTMITDNTSYKAEKKAYLDELKAREAKLKLILPLIKEKMDASIRLHDNEGADNRAEALRSTMHQLDVIANNMRECEQKLAVTPDIGPEEVKKGRGRNARYCFAYKGTKWYGNRGWQE